MNAYNKALALALLVALLAGPAAASGAGKIDELERRIDVLAGELATLKEAQVLPETRELKSAYGMGPAASKVYSKERGLSIGGYGEFNYANYEDAGEDDITDFYRFVLYFGYKFNDWIIMNSEIEFEHATDDNGTVSVEFAYLDFMFNEAVNARAGLMLVPVGFINEMHEPPFYHGNMRPTVERQLIPSTWQANGVGLFGQPFAGLSYRSYLVTSLLGSEFSESNLRSGRQKGSKEKSNDWSWVTRIDYTPVPGLSLGGSAYLGDQGQDVALTDADNGSALGSPDAKMEMFEGHIQWKSKGLELRALGISVDLDDADILSRAKYKDDTGKSVAEKMTGWYLEAAYDVMPLLAADSGQYLAPWVRYSTLDSQATVPTGYTANKDKDRSVVEVGLTYKPIPNVVVKLDYRDWSDKSGADPSDEVRLGAGYIF
ncbi:MAG: hypothetical protein VCA74_08300 [Deltaproteobacteria bacterium]